MTGTLNRSCHKLGKESNKGEIVQGITLGMGVTPIYVDTIAQGLECIEGYTYRKYEM